MTEYVTRYIRCIILQMIKQETETDKVKDRLFVRIDSKDQEENRQLGLVVNPEIMQILFAQARQLEKERKVGLLRELSAIYRSNRNSSILLWNRDREIQSHNISILDDIIDFLFSIDWQKQEVQEAAALFEPFVSGYSLTCRNIRKLTHILSRDFYAGIFQPARMSLAIEVLKRCFVSQAPDRANPITFFLLYGQNSGIKLFRDKSLWGFSKGFVLNMSFQVQHINRYADLLYLRVKDSEFSVGVTIDKKLVVRVFGQTQHFEFTSIAPGTWYYLRLEYLLKSGIFSKQFSLKLWLNDKAYEKTSLPIPEISQNDQLTELIFGRDLQGKINSIFLSRSHETHQLVGRNERFWIQSWAGIESLLRCNKHLYDNLYLLYVPFINTEVNDKTYIYELSSRNHGQLLENTVVFQNNFHQSDINSYGGLFNLLPLFYIIRFYDPQAYPELLQDALSLVLTVFKHKYQKVEEQALNCKFFDIIGAHLTEISQEFVTLSAIQTLSALKAEISETKLKEQFFLNLLWKLNVKEIRSIEVIRELMSLIKGFYQINPKFYLSLWGVEHCLHYLEQNFEPIEPELCCLQHYMQSSPNSDDCPQVSNSFSTSEPLFNLILFVARASLEDNLDNGLAGVELILRFLTGRHSNCYRKFLVSLLAGIYGLQIPGLRPRMGQRCRLLPYLFLLLGKTTSYDVLEALLSLLHQIHALGKEDSPRVLWMVASHLKKLNLSDQELRQKTRSVSTQASWLHEHRRESFTLEQKPNAKVVELAQLIRLRKKNISNYRPLMSVVMQFATGEDEEEGLLNDEAMMLLLQYYHLSCDTFRKEIVIGIWESIMSCTPDLKQDIRDNYYMLMYFLCRVLANAYIDRYCESGFLVQIEHHIIQILKALAFVGTPNSPSPKPPTSPKSFYEFYLRIQSLLHMVRRDVEAVVEASHRAEVAFVCRYIMRKLLEAVVEDETAAVAGVGLTFAVHSSLFCDDSEADQDQESVEEFQILEYFGFLEKEKQLFLVDKKVIPTHVIARYPEAGVVFIDLPLIEKFIARFDFNKYKLEEPNVYNKVAMYLDPNFSGEFAQIKQKLFEEINCFEDKKDSDKSEFLDFFERLFENSIIEVDTPEDKQIKQLSQQNVVAVETLVLMLQVSLEYTLRKHLLPSFKRLLGDLEQLIKITVLVCENCAKPAKSLPTFESNLLRKLLLQYLHFLYNLLENEAPIEFNESIERCLTRVFYFLFMNIEILNQKLGNVATFEDALHFGSIIKSVENYNLVLIEMFDRHVKDDKRKSLLTLAKIKEIRYFDQEKLLEEVLSDRYKQFFKRSKTVGRLLGAEIQRELVGVRSQHRKLLSQQLIETKLRLARENFGYELSKEATTVSQESQACISRSQMSFLKEQNYQYRSSMCGWNKIWKQLRLYHYSWSVWTNQKEDKDWGWQSRKTKNPYIRRKFCRFESDLGTRPFLTVKLIEPWHVKKLLIQRELEYINKDYHYNFYKNQAQGSPQTKNKFWLLGKIFRKDTPTQEDQFKVEWIMNNEKRRGFLQILADKMQFTYQSIYQKDSHLDFTHFRLGEFKQLFKNWELAHIRNISRRRYLMKYQCILVEMENNSSVIFNFVDGQLDDFLQLINKKQKSKADNRAFLKLNNIRFYTEKFDYEVSELEALTKQKTEDWIARKISNFDYLMFLNKVAGRSFYDPTQYPVFPWIISDYTCRELVYRPLDKSMGALGSEARKDIIREKSKSFDPFNPVPLYQYGTHYSSPGVIFNYLIRLNPYTQAARILQGGKFDISDRLFYSLLWCWRSATTEMSDVRELTPEFYYMPEFLINTEYYDFGITQLKDRVNNVELPLWADADPYTFISVHRKAFESEQVSAAIHQWIDLIFGFKQKGKEAEDNLNLFYYLTYENAVNLDKIQDQVSKTSIEAQIMHFGQTPCQLFYKPHLPRDEKPKKKWLLTGSACQIFSPRISGTNIWDQITTFSRGNQPIICLNLKNGSVLEAIKCYSWVSYSLGTEPTFLSEQTINFKKTKNQIHLADLTFANRVVFFGGGKYLASGINLNGQLRIYNSQGKQIEVQAGSIKNCIYVNNKENLILTGSRDALFEVYEIIYQEKDQLSLVSIATENFFDPITHISQGFGFYAVCAGSLISIYNIIRSAAFVNKKSKKVRCKFIRSYVARNKVLGARIYSTPLFGVAFYDSTTLWSYSANGQLITSKSISVRLQPQLMKDSQGMDLLLCLDQTQLYVMTTPTLNTIRTVPLPLKEYTCWKVYPDIILLGTSSGEIVVINQEI